MDELQKWNYKIDMLDISNAGYTKLQAQLIRTASYVLVKKGGEQIKIEEDILYDLTDVIQIKQIRPDRAKSVPSFEYYMN